MKPPPFEYHSVATVPEATALLAQHGDDAKVLAGGQSLVPLLALRLARPEQLVDINNVDELSHIQVNGDVRLGSLVRQRVAERSPEVRAALPMMTAALRAIGHPAIRNRGTIGGSVAHADPSAELPMILTALDGEIDVVSERGARTISAADLFAGFLTTTIEPDELVREVRLPRLPPGAGWSLHEFSRRSGDFAVVGVATVLQLDGDGSVGTVRIALSGVAGTPVRATAAESGLIGHAPEPNVLDDAASMAADDVDPPSDVHGTAAYRRHLVRVLTARALREARERAESAT